MGDDFFDQLLRAFREMEKLTPEEVFKDYSPNGQPIYFRTGDEPKGCMTKMYADGKKEVVPCPIPPN